MTWILTSDRLPEAGTEVLVRAGYDLANPDGSFAGHEEWTDIAKCDGYSWQGNSYQTESAEVYYWMPLPEMPEPSIGEVA